MEHRYERRIACTLSIELYRTGEHIGAAEVQNASNNGLRIRTPVSLHPNEIIHVRFPDRAGQRGWPDEERAIVAHTENNQAGLLFDRSVFRNLSALQKTGKESGGCPAD